MQPDVAPSHPRGDDGFDWTACFIPDGHAQTYAEMTSAEQTAVAARFGAAKAQRPTFSPKRSPRKG